MAKSNTAKKELSIDSRGRITLPKELRKGVDAFSIKHEKNGSLCLVPKKSVSMIDAKLLKDLKKSIKEVKEGKTTPIPKEWIE